MEPENNQSQIPKTEDTEPTTPPEVDAPTPKPVVMSPKGNKKRLVMLGLVAAAVILLIAGAVAAYTGVIGPRNPNNIWASAMNNTGRGYDKLVDYQKQHAGDKGGEVKGTYKIDGSSATDGSFEAKWFEDSASGKADIGLGTTRAVLEFRAIKSVSTYPDIYVQASGLKGLGAQFGSPELEQIIGQINNQWIAIDHTLLDNLQKQAGGSQATTGELTQADINQIAIKTGEALKEYVFTDDSKKAVLVVKERLGQEQRDGRDVYHYKAGVDKQHLKDFVTALKDKLKETKIKQLLGQRSVEDAINYEQMLKDIDKMDTNKAVADVWVDMKTKLFHAVRFYEEGKADNYIEFGTPYTGGDEVPFVIKTADKSGSDSAGDIRIVYNTKTNETKLNASFSDKTKDDTTKVDLTAVFKASNTAVNVQKPAGAKPLAELFGLSQEQLFSVFGTQLNISEN